MIKRYLSVAAAVGLTAMLLGPAPQASASASTSSQSTITGEVTFECVANLPAFPTGGATRPGTCGDGAVPAEAVGGAAGDTNGTPDPDPYTAVSDPTTAQTCNPLGGNFCANFGYEEPCPPATGTARGTAKASVLVTGGGAVRKPMTAEADFSWLRVGLTAVIVIEKARIMDGATVFAHHALDPGQPAGAAVAVFVPLTLQPGNVIGCPPPDTPIQALVHGEAVFGA